MVVDVKVPEVGESITEVQIGEWKAAVGDHVEAGTVLVEIESDKATVEAYAETDGVLTEILKQTGETAGIGEVIGHVEEQAATPASKSKRAASKQKAHKKAEAPPEPKDETKTAPSETPDAPPPSTEKETAKAPAPAPPTAESAPEAAHEASPAPPRPTPPDETRTRVERTVPMTPMRRTIAARLVEAQQTAALLTTFNEVDMTAVLELRARHREEFEKLYKVKLGLVSFFVKACVEALERFPQINARIRGNDIVYHDYQDIGIAMGAGKGLVVPVLRNAGRMAFHEIETAIADFAARAKENKIRLDELEGGTFTISNGGVYGSLLSTPIVNPPQSGVLGMHAVQDRPVAIDGQVVVRPMMYIALTYDHRIIDGREAVTFLRAVKQAAEDPGWMLVNG